MMWMAYLIALHLLALPGSYMLCGVLYVAFLDLTTNVSTGQARRCNR